VVDERGGELGGLGMEAVEAGGEPGLWSDGDLCAASGDGVEDAVGSALGGGGEDGGFGGDVEPGLFAGDLTGEFGVGFAAGAHEAGADGGDADAFVAELGVEAFGEAGEGELAGDVGEHVGHGELAADAGDVDDAGVGCVAGAAEEIGQRGVGGVEGGEEVDVHGAVEGVEGLVFDGADFDDSGIVDEDVDFSEGPKRGLDETGGLVGVGEVGGDEEDVVFVAQGAAVEEGLAGAGELVFVAGGEDEIGSGAGVALGESEAEAAGAAGDHDHFAGLRGLFFRK